MSQRPGQTTLLTRISHSLKLTTAELLVVLIYPTTIILGQLIHHTSPEIVENYYTNKHNLLNVLFVKKGWFWTCLIDIYFVLQHKESIQRAFARLTITTIWWYTFTQWFFGIPIMDRVFVWTGGVCDYDVNVHGSLEVVGSMVCRQVKGHWKGGHDPSGHVFLLVLGSMVLWFEVVNAQVVVELKQIFRIVKESKNWGDKVKNIFGSSTLSALALLWLWWWMLLTTSIHFHSFIEQMSGLIAGCLGVLVYTIPRLI